ncbi:hypothetical protein H9655_02670 [Cytobacillus sp. Sa5YUA1]|uniref:Uncharacterized protein n=1 Tax=Cytobacillus stercorigallinarum TaxID=2762240 RepID=A0ABR8QK70_9BACI|nr:hypothetical protein [Cytobacillus stercorigallinarum]MBD7935920.1 hypothetical protein [Cytobacillus stercorigallinarum]
MKTLLNLNNEAHLKLLQDTAFKAIDGISIQEVLNLQKSFKDDPYMYFNQVKLKYLLPLGMLGLSFKINQEVEHALFQYISYVLHELELDRHMDSPEAILNFS